MTKGQTRKALVLGTDSRMFLSVARSLGRGGVEVHAAWYEPDALALRSRYLSRLHSLPPYHPTDMTWKKALLELMARERFDLVLPCTEMEANACQQHRADLEKYGRVYTLPAEVYDILLSKSRTTDLARSMGVRVPREVPVTDAGQSEELIAQLGLPVVLKPLTPMSATSQARRNVRKAYALAELLQLLPDMLQAGPLVAQENFIGQGVGVELLLQEGEPLLTFQHRRIHEPLHGGPSAYREGVAVSPELLEAALKVLRPLRYTGVAMAEFKVNRDTGEWVFLEINARFWGSLPLAVASDADFPLALFELLVEGRKPARSSGRTGICCRNWTRDLDWLGSNFRADRSDPTLATQPLPRVVGDLCWNILTLRERSDTFALDDPGPGLAELGRLALRFGGRLARMCRLGRAAPAAAQPRQSGEREVVASR